MEMEKGEGKKILEEGEKLIKEGGEDIKKVASKVFEGKKDKAEDAAADAEEKKGEGLKNLAGKLKKD